MSVILVGFAKPVGRHDVELLQVTYGVSRFNLHDQRADTRQQIFQPAGLAPLINLYTVLVEQIGIFLSPTGW